MLETILSALKIAPAAERRFNRAGFHTFGTLLIGAFSCSGNNP